MSKKISAVTITDNYIGSISLVILLFPIILSTFTAMKKRVLVFDTEIGELSKIHLDLILNDYEVEVTDSSSEILLRTKRFDPDIVILNSHVPDFDCTTICTTIRERLNVPIVVLGHAAPVVDNCKAIAFLQKPIKKIKLLGTISQLTVANNDACCE